VHAAHINSIPSTSKAVGTSCSENTDDVLYKCVVHTQLSTHSSVLHLCWSAEVLCQQLAEVATVLVATTFPTAPASNSTSSNTPSQVNPPLTQHAALAAAWERTARLLVGVSATVPEVRFNICQQHDQVQEYSPICLVDTQTAVARLQVQPNGHMLELHS
jgi:hypothetical protein